MSLATAIEALLGLFCVGLVVDWAGDVYQRRVRRWMLRARWRVSYAAFTVTRVWPDRIWRGWHKHVRGKPRCCLCTAPATGEIWATWHDDEDEPWRWSWELCDRHHDRNVAHLKLPYVAMDLWLALGAPSDIRRRRPLEPELHAGARAL